MKKKRRKRKGRAASLRPLKGLRPGLRMKGGVLFDPDVNGFRAIVHVWDNVDCHGLPDEWRSPEPFPTEASAMHYYKTSIRPHLKQMMGEMAKRKPSTSWLHREDESAPVPSSSPGPEFEGDDDAR